MAKVTGIGGFFFAAKNPGELATWYKENLGINLVPQSMDDKPWEQKAGATAFQPVENISDIFGEDTKIDSSKKWALNFRVDDLNGMIEQLESNGITVTKDPNEYPMGTFAQLEDIEGNPVQLWQIEV